MNRVSGLYRDGEVVDLNIGSTISFFIDVEQIEIYILDCKTDITTEKI